MHQTFEKISLAMTHKLDDMIELPNSQPKKTNYEDLKCGIVSIKIRRCMSFLGNTNIYVKHMGSLDMMNNKVENPSSQSTLQVLPSFEEYTPPATYLEEVEETLGTPMEVEPLDQMKLEDEGMDTCNHDIPLSYREVPSFDDSEPQLQPLPNCPSLDVSLGDERDPELPIKPYSPDMFRMKVVDHLTTHIPPSPYVANFHLKGV
ncbi:hypothetical protein Tco_1219758 [Tanacetum coccineum]